MAERTMDAWTEEQWRQLARWQQERRPHFDGPVHAEYVTDLLLDVNARLMRVERMLAEKEVPRG